MSFSIGSLTFTFSVDNVVNNSKAIARDMVALDFSEEKWGETPEEQLNGRNKAITQNLVFAVIGAVGMAVAIFHLATGVGSPVVNATFLGGFTCATALYIKNVALQSIAREKDMKAFTQSLEMDEFSKLASQRSPSSS